MMTNLVRMEFIGDQLAIVADDGTKHLGYPTGLGSWVYTPISLSADTGTPDPGNGGGDSTPSTGSGLWQWPFQYSKYVFTTGPIAPLTQYGMRVNPVSGKYIMHWGLDFGKGGIAGMPIPAAAAGTVTESTYNAAMGNHVILSHDGGFITRYFHMVRTPDVKLGQKVTKGQTLGNVGSTGNATGPHLHWETYEKGVHVNPRDFMKHRGVPET